MDGSPPAFLLALIGLTVVNVAAAAWAARAWPVGVRKLCQDLRERVLAVETKVDGLAAKWATNKAELAEFLEAAEDVLDAVERKRRRATAAESAVKAREEVQPGGGGGRSRADELRRLARSKGFAV